MMSSYCGWCGGPKEPADYAADMCATCKTRRSEAMQHFKVEHPEASESDVLYAGRQSLMQRAHTAHRNFVDPRDFSAVRRTIPTAPQSGQKS